MTTGRRQRVEFGSTEKKNFKHLKFKDSEINISLSTTALQQVLSGSTGQHRQEQLEVCAQVG